MSQVTFVQGGFSPIGGIEMFAVDLLGAFQTRQNQTELICWDAAHGRKNPAFDELARIGVKVHRAGWRWGCRRGWPDKWMARRFWQRMMEAEVLVFGKMLHESVHRELMKTKKRMVLVTPYRPAEMWKERRPDDDILNSFESIVVQAGSFEDDLRKSGYKGHVFVLPYLPPGAREISAWPANPPLQVGFLGRLVPQKNLKYLIHSFSHLRKMGSEAKLHLFGDGPERDRLQSLTDQMGLAGHIRFHGNLDRSRIAAAIDSCHIFAFSSRTEGQCLAALEILARGRPVLGTPVGAFPEFLTGRLGSVVPLDDPEAFAAAMHALARPMLNGAIAPEDIQKAYLRRFPRQNVIEEYMQVFGCCDTAQRKAQAV
jgi:glycosyltransferase involved in cell wall biosynthesis